MFNKDEAEALRDVLSRQTVASMHDDEEARLIYGVLGKVKAMVEVQRHPPMVCKPRYDLPKDELVVLVGVLMRDLLKCDKEGPYGTDNQFAVMEIVEWFERHNLEI